MTEWAFEERISRYRNGLKGLCKAHVVSILGILLAIPILYLKFREEMTSIKVANIV